MMRAFNGLLIFLRSAVMTSKRLYAWETAECDENALLLLCGDVEYKIASNTLTLDRKIRYRLPLRSLLAFKLLRQAFSAIVRDLVRHPGKQLSPVQQKWWTLGVGLLGGSNTRLAQIDIATLELAPRRDVITA